MTGITLLEGERPTTAVFTDEPSPEIDSVQYETGSGPCLGASREQCNKRIDSATEEARWVDFCRAAAAKGVHSVMSLPLAVKGQGIGALTRL